MSERSGFALQVHLAAVSTWLFAQKINSGRNVVAPLSVLPIGSPLDILLILTSRLFRTQGGRGGRVHRRGKDVGHSGAQRETFTRGRKRRREGRLRGYPSLGVNAAQ